MPDTSVTVDKDSILTASDGTTSTFSFTGGVVPISAGTYRIVFDSSGSATSANCWKISGATPVTTVVAPSSFVSSTTTDVTAGPPITWTDSLTANQPTVRMMLDHLAGTGGTSTPYIIGG